MLSCDVLLTSAPEDTAQMAALKVIAGMSFLLSSESSAIQNESANIKHLNNSAVSALKANNWYEQDAQCFNESLFFVQSATSILVNVSSNIMWFLQSILNHMVWLVSKGTTKFQRKSLPLFSGLMLNTSI